MTTQATFITFSNISDGRVITIDPSQHDSAKEATLYIHEQILKAGSISAEVQAVDMSADLAELNTSNYGADQRIWDFLDCLNDGMDADMIKAAIKTEIPLDRADEHYVGHFANELDGSFDLDSFGRFLIEAHIETLLPVALQEYFDYEKYAQSELINSYKVHKCHVFHSYGSIN